VSFGIGRPASDLAVVSQHPSQTQVVGAVTLEQAHPNPSQGRETRGYGTLSGEASPAWDFEFGLEEQVSRHDVLTASFARR